MHNRIAYATTVLGAVENVRKLSEFFPWGTPYGVAHAGDSVYNSSIANYLIREDCIWSGKEEDLR